MSDAEKIVRFPDMSAVEAEAAEWVVRLENGEGTAEDYAKFQEWQSRSPLHREAVLRLSGVWSDLDVLKEFAVPFSSRAEIEVRRHGVSELLRDAAFEAPWWKIACATACALVVVAAGLLYTHFLNTPPTVIPYETAVGALKTVTLPDGSTMLLNTNSKLDVAFSRTGRDIHLMRGEAYFEVAHDDKRPFTVFSGGRRVRDIGTAFDVHLLQKTVEVTVTKGSVELAALTGPAQSSAMSEQRLGVLTAGQNAVFDRKIEYLKSVSDADINRRLAWRQGILIYAGEPLVKVVADASRYTNVKIVLGDSKLENIPVGGYFEIGKINALFEALESNFGIRAQWLDNTHVRLMAVDDEIAQRPIRTR